MHLRAYLLPLGLLVACSGEEVKETGLRLEGPEILHTPPTGAVEETALTLDVTATDPEGVASVLLFHRISGETTWV